MLPAADRTEIPSTYHANRVRIFVSVRHFVRSGKNGKDRARGEIDLSLLTIEKLPKRPDWLSSKCHPVWMLLHLLKRDTPSTFEEVTIKLLDIAGLARIVG